MEKQRQIKILSIVALVLAISAMTLGFAAFSTTLSISSSASVTPNSDSFAVKFSTNKDSLVVGAVAPSSKTDGITANSGTIDNSASPTLTNLSASFTSPGQYVEYTVYARNEGEYTAYLNNINYIGNKTCTASTGTTEALVQSACEYINVKVTIGSTTYTETTPITAHPLAKGAGEEVKVRLEYDSNGTSVDGSFSITFPNIALVYSTIDDSSIQPTIPKVASLDSGNLNTPGSIVSIGNEKFYVIGQENGYVKLFAMFNLYAGGVYDGSQRTEYGSEATGIQDSSMKGYVGQEVRFGTLPFSKTNYWSNTVQSYPMYVYDSNSIIYNYVENYKGYIESLGVNVATARLIAQEELESLGCSSANNTCGNAPKWVYSTAYWTGTAIKNNSLRYVNGVTHFDSYPYNYGPNAGIRPIIEIPITEF